MTATNSVGDETKLTEISSLSVTVPLIPSFVLSPNMTAQNIAVQAILAESVKSVSSDQDSQDQDITRNPINDGLPENSKGDVLQSSEKSASYAEFLATSDEFFDFDEVPSLHRKLLNNLPNVAVAWQEYLNHIRHTKRLRDEKMAKNRAEKVWEFIERFPIGKLPSETFDEMVWEMLEEGLVEKTDKIN